MIMNIHFMLHISVTHCYCLYITGLIALGRGGFKNPLML